MDNKKNIEIKFIEKEILNIEQPKPEPKKKLQLNKLDGGVLERWLK